MASVLTALLLLAAVVFVVVVVGAPLRAGDESRQASELAGRIADLEAQKEARYGEIREAELDHRTGKLSDGDWRIVDRGLRADAARILHELDGLGAGER